MIAPAKKTKCSAERQDQENVQRKRWASEGVLYTGDVLAEPSPVKITPEIIQSCKGK